MFGPIKTLVPVFFFIVKETTALILIINILSQAPTFVGVYLYTCL